MLRIGTWYQTFAENLISGKSEMDMTRLQLPFIYIRFPKSGTVDRVTLFGKVTVEGAIQLMYLSPRIKIKCLKPTIYALYSSDIHGSSLLHAGSGLCQISLSFAKMDTYRYRVAIQLPKWSRV